MTTAISAPFAGWAGNTAYDEPYVICPTDQGGCGVELVAYLSLDEDVATKNSPYVRHFIDRHRDGNPTADVAHPGHDGEGGGIVADAVAIHFGLTESMATNGHAQALNDALGQIGACWHEDGDAWGDSALETWGERAAHSVAQFDSSTLAVHITVYARPLLVASARHMVTSMLGGLIRRGPRFTDATDWRQPATRIVEDCDGHPVDLPHNGVVVDVDNFDLVAEEVQRYTGGANLHHLWGRDLLPGDVFCWYHADRRPVIAVYRGATMIGELG